MNPVAKIYIRARRENVTSRWKLGLNTVTRTERFIAIDSFTSRA